MEVKPLPYIPYTDELRKELGSIKGVGEKRLDEIMAVIEKHLGIN